MAESVMTHVKHAAWGKMEVIMVPRHSDSAIAKSGQVVPTNGIGEPRTLITNRGHNQLTWTADPRD